MQDSIQFSRSEMVATPLNSQVDFSQYDLPRVFRTSKSSHDAPLLANSARISNDLDAEFYEIPSFLRKQAEEDQAPSVKVNPLLPRDVIAIANTNIAPKISIDLFVREVESKLFSDELKFVFDKLQNVMSREQSWIIILSWILFKLSDDLDWNEDTKERIEQMVNELEPKTFNAGLDVVNHAFKHLSPIRWE
jgi:hypothetical protein